MFHIEHFEECGDDVLFELRNGHSLDTASRGFRVEREGKDLSDFEGWVVDVVFLVVDCFAAKVFCEGSGVDAAVGYIAVDTGVSAALIGKGSEAGCASTVGLS